MANNKIGALWGPNQYGGFTGVIEVDGKKIDVILFANKNKKNNKQPDFDICHRRPKGDDSEKTVERDDIPF